MLKLLLDEHISPEVAEGLRHRNKKMTVFHLAEWENKRFLGQPDDFLLREAARQDITLVTYDLKTIPPLLKLWAESGLNHGGLIFIDNKTIPQSDIGGIIHALKKLISESTAWDWQNRICYLRR